MSTDARVEAAAPAGAPSEEEVARAIEQLDRAHDLVCALCKPRGVEGAREWRMSIPAQPDYDPDLVIGRALRDARALLAHSR